MNRRALLAAAGAALLPGATRAPEAISPGVPAVLRPSFGSLLNEADLSNPGRESMYRRLCSRFTLAGPIYARFSHARQGRVDVSGALDLVHRMKGPGTIFRGHTLVWHRLTAAWMPGARSGAERALRSHIEGVTRPLAHAVDEWDVINEPISLTDGDHNGLRFAPWYSVLGPSYIEIALRQSRISVPVAQLGINENRIEADDTESSRRRRALLALARRLLDADVPLDYIGLQGHVDTAHHYTRRGVGSFVRELHAMGLRVHITEFDVSDYATPADFSMRDRRIAEACARYFDATLGDGLIDSVTSWGLFDDSSWLQHEHPRSDGLAHRPLPFDERGEAKPLWREIRAHVGPEVGS